jgi:hypothetical protein
LIELFCAASEPASAVAALPGCLVLEVEGIPCVGRPLDAARTAGAIRGEDLVEHDAVVRTVMRATPVVPFRYGTVVADGDDLRRALKGKGPALRRTLYALRGRVELAVRAQIEGADPTPGSGGGGRGYLARLRSVSSELSGLHEALIATAVAGHASYQASMLKGSYLVEGPDVAEFCEGARRMAAARPAVLEFSVTGPWPPYSFTEMGS